MSNLLFIIFGQKFKEPETEVKLDFILLFNRSPAAVSKRQRDAPCRWTIAVTRSH